MNRNRLLSDKQIDEICEVHPYHAQLYAKRTAVAVDAMHEAARAKDAETVAALTERLDNTEKALRIAELGKEQMSELIQRLMDALDKVRDAFEMYASCRCDGSGCPVCRVIDRADNALFSAKNHGFKPSEQ